MALKSRELKLARQSSVAVWARRHLAEARAFLKSRDILIVRTLITDWQAYEDPTWRQYVMELTVRATPSKAMQIWDELNEELAKAIKAEPDSFRLILQEKVSLAVKWTNAAV
ncbi:MAG: hypothetical protein EXR47_06665 [Dehalococcoidia bacterium]|nr:hypothetical protein [Dehalococcoidia bacterium]